MLAQWPIDFVNSSNVQQRGPVRTKRSPFTITNQGIELPITWRAWSNVRGNPPRLKVMLDCGTCGPQGFRNIGLQLVNPSGLFWGRFAAHTLDTQVGASWYNPLDTFENPWYTDSEKKSIPHPRMRRAYSEIEKNFARTPEEQVHGLRVVMVASDWSCGDLRAW